MTVMEAIGRVQQIQQALGQVTEAVSRNATAPASAADFAATLSALTPPTAQRDANGATGEAVVAAARSYVGVPYVFGGEDASGMDCSGLVQRVFADLGVEVPRLVRGQMTVGTEVPSLAEARPGDLIVSKGGEHIVIYAGEGKIIHAPYAGRDVSFQDNYLGEADIETIRRILPAGSVASAPGAPGDLLSAALAAAVRGQGA